MKIKEFSIKTLREAIKNGKISVFEILDEVEKEIKERDPLIRSFISTRIDEVRAEAKFLLKENENYFKNDELKLGGIPIAIKDNMNISGERTTCGSRILENFIAPYDATVVKKLKESGALLIGKTNMDEFAMGSSCENSTFFKTKNPINLEYVPGGSSGGSAACVKAGFVLGSLGSDTGGSIRQPASFTGIAGMKPTYGRVSRYGLVAFASSLDQIGPFGKNVEDTALILSVIEGYDENDSTSVNIPRGNYNDSFKKDLKGKKIGVIKNIEKENMDSSIQTAMNESIKALEKAGAQIIEVEIPTLEYVLSIYYIIAPAEASSNLARYDGVRYGLRIKGSSLRDTYRLTRDVGFGKEVKRRILIGTYVLSSGYYDAYYSKALKARNLLKEDFKKAFETVDVLFMPTSPSVAFKFGERKDPLKMYLSDIFTIPANLAGLPAISIPIGVDENNLPIGGQFIGKQFREDEIFEVSFNLEKILRG